MFVLIKLSERSFLENWKSQHESTTLNFQAHSSPSPSLKGFLPEVYNLLLRNYDRKIRYIKCENAMRSVLKGVPPHCMLPISLCRFCRNNFQFSETRNRWATEQILCMILRHNLIERSRLFCNEFFCMHACNMASTDVWIIQPYWHTCLTRQIKLGWRQKSADKNVIASIRQECWHFEHMYSDLGWIPEVKWLR